MKLGTLPPPAKVGATSTLSKVGAPGPVQKNNSAAPHTGEAFAEQLEMNRSPASSKKEVGPLRKGLETQSSARNDAPSPLKKSLEKVLQQESEVQNHLKKVMKRGVGSMEELLNIQMSVYRYTQHVELLSKTVDRSTQCLKQTLQTRL